MKEVLAENLKSLRKAKGFRQDDIAAASGIPKSTYVQIELGNSWPQLANLKALAGTLNVHESVLFADREAMPKPSPTEALEIVKNALEKAECRERDISAAGRALLDLLPALDQNELTALVVTFAQTRLKDRSARAADSGDQIKKPSRRR